MMRVVSIQSFVSYGYVGNSAAMPPLLALGLEVIPVHTVLFSSHPGYEGWRGHALSPEHLSALLAGLHLRLDQTPAQAILLGYLHDQELAAIVWSFVLERRRRDPSIKIICDPVLGDQGQLYVSEGLLSFYRAHLQDADLILPNQDELGWLLERPVGDLEHAQQAIRQLSQRCDAAVALTGLKLAQTPKRLHVLLSEPQAATPLTLEHALVPGVYAGCGDVFSALVTAWWLRLDDLKLAIMRAGQELEQLVTMTHALGLDRLAMTPWLERLGRQDVEPD